MSYLILLASMIGFCYYYDWSVWSTAALVVSGLAIWAVLMNRQVAIPKW